MNSGTYINQRDRLLNTFDCGPVHAEDERMEIQYNLMSASLFNFLPGIKYEKHRSIFNHILLHQRLSILEQSHVESLDFVELNSGGDETMQLLRKQPAIICTFHLGSYRVLNLLLIKERIPFSLVIGKEVMEKEGDSFRGIFNKSEKYGDSCEFGLINAEDPGSVLRMLKELKKGRSLVLYIDGNTGAGAATSKNENNCVVNFLGQQVYARKGIAWMAHIAGVPIVVAVSCRKKWETINIRFFDPIHPDLKDRNEFAESATQYIYELVSPLIKENPEQWEGWLYLHKTARVININPAINHVKKRQNNGKKTVFNSSLFGKFKINGIPFLLQKQGYEFYETGEDLYKVLVSCTNQPAEKEIFGEELFNQLWQRGVLINAPG